MSVTYLANWTRPDVAFAVSKSARFMQAPGPKHVKELKRVLRYLRCNRDLGSDFCRGECGMSKSVSTFLMFAMRLLARLLSHGTALQGPH